MDMRKQMKLYLETVRESKKEKTTIMVCVICDEEVIDDLGYWYCSSCNDIDGIEEVDKKEWYGEKKCKK